MELTQEIKDLFRLVRTRLGAPIRPIQLSDEQLCDLLEIAIGDYAEKVQNWIIQANWLNFQGKPFQWLQNPQDLAHMFTMRQLDFSRDFSYWFSKEVGLQQRGHFELKKDFFQVEHGKQTYLVPAGREINKVLYVTPSTTKAALYGNVGALDTGIGGGFAQYGHMGYGGPGFYVYNMYDSALIASDLNYKNSWFRGDLTYKVTAGPEGTHIIHLMSTPGSPNMMGGIAADDNWGWNKFVHCYVWYTYYDVNGASDSEIDACRLENKDDILITPDQVPLSKMRYELMNEPTKNTIRQLLTAEAFITLGIIRGTNSGKVLIPNAELQLDYNMLLEEGRREKERVFNELKERLESMLPWNLMEKMKMLTENNLDILKTKAMPQPFIFI